MTPIAEPAADTGRTSRGRAAACPAARLVMLLAALAAAPAAAQGGAAHERALPMSLGAGFETVRLPGGERMGLANASLLFEAAPDWWLGGSVHGAASGERGGLFVGGLEVQRRWQFGPRRLVAGLFGGGGGGAAAPVGGGLMWRPSLALLQDFGGWQGGLTWSHVRFPSGSIASSQFGLVLAWDGRFRHAALERVGETVRDETRSGVGVDRVLATATRVVLDDGSRPGRRIGLAGGRLERTIAASAGTAWTAGFEAAGAASGDAAGYMEILAGVGGWLVPLPQAAPGLRLGLRAALGLGGGGAVPTGGGLIGKAALGASLPLGAGWHAGAEWGALRAADTSLRGRQLQLWLAADLEPAGQGRLQRTEWSAVVQHHTRVPRRDGTKRALQTIGLKLNRYAGEHLYLSGQAHSAFAGGAGAYSIGLVGAGIATAASRPGWQGGVELLVGAAGGGGVDSAGGALVQALGWAALPPAAAGAGVAPTQWRIGVGVQRLRSGGGTSPVFEIGWTRAFAQAAP